MTVKEALELKGKMLSLSSAEIDLALLDANLTGSDLYAVATNGKEVDLVAAGLLLTTIRNKRVSEDDVTIEGPDVSLLKLAYSAIMRKWDLPDPFAPVVSKPTVKQVRFW